MADAALETMLGAFVAERRYSAATLQRWLALDPPDARALLEVAQELRPSENQLRDIWEWAEDIAHRDGSSLTRVLAEETLVVARRWHVGRNDRLKLLMHALRRLRLPQLAAVEDQIAARINELALPRNIRVSVPQFLEGDEVRVEIVASSAAALQDAARALADAATTPTCQAIFTLLEEAP